MSIRSNLHTPGILEVPASHDEIRLPGMRNVFVVREVYVPDCNRMQPAKGICSRIYFNLSDHHGLASKLTEYYPPGRASNPNEVSA